MDTELQLSEDVLLKLDKLFNTDTTEMEKMLAVLDIEHSIVISDKLGIIGEFSNKSEDILHDNHLGRLHENLDKRGDCFIPVGEYATLIIEEKITHTFLVSDSNKDITKYIFIIKDVSVEDKVDTFFDDCNAEQIPAIIIYDSEKDNIRTNCKALRYKYDENLSIELLVCGNKHNYRVTDGDKEYTSYILDYNNNISVLKEITN